MEAKFPTADRSGQFNDTGAIPVTITGVGFFDPPHRQTRRATNNIELHSVLDIDFGDGQPSCLGTSQAAADFSMAANPAALAVAAGSAASTALSVVPTNGFAGTVSFSVSGQPTGVTSSIIVGPVGAVSLQVSANAATVPGTSSLVVTGTSGGLTRTVTIPLTINAAATSAWEYKLITATTNDALLQQANTLGA